MGKEVGRSTFSAEHEQEFGRRLDAETDRLLDLAATGGIACRPQHIGQEIEACLVDSSFMPSPINAKFLENLADPHATTELANFNIEFNPPKEALAPGVFSRLQASFDKTLSDVFDVAERLHVHLVMTGILPTVTPGDLSMPMMSRSNRYQAFVDRLGQWKDGEFCTISIDHNEGLQLGIATILMEAVTTSQQIHLQVPEPGSAQYYNVAQLLAGPLAAAGANSPYFLGRDLWAETRIPLFEQILRPRFDAPGRNSDRAQDFFGHSYVERSMTELFTANRDALAIVIPELFDDKPDSLPHLGMHNGTIWRWNRPVYACDENGVPTLRIEYRALPSGPTCIDMCANVALFVGCVLGLVKELGDDALGPALERRLPFARTRANFYSCARDGLAAQIDWLDGKRLRVDELFKERLLPLARKTLIGMDMTPEDLAILEIAYERIACGVTGSSWQRQYMNSLGGGSPATYKMIAAYWRRQLQGKPVHTWTR